MWTAHDCSWLLCRAIHWFFTVTRTFVPSNRSAASCQSRHPVRRNTARCQRKETKHHLNGPSKALGLEGGPNPSKGQQDPSRRVQRAGPDTVPRGT